MPVEAISQSVSRLHARKEAIEQELADIDSRFRAIAQTLNAHGPVEAFNEGVLVGLARLDESDLDAIGLAPFGKGVAGQL
jgi:hypothetical protein